MKSIPNVYFNNMCFILAPSRFGHILVAGQSPGPKRHQNRTGGTAPFSGQSDFPPEASNWAAIGVAFPLLGTPDPSFPAVSSGLDRFVEEILFKLNNFWGRHQK